ncbi:hypothetical protein ACTGYU_11920, partial [Streptococcus suis]
VRDSVNKILFGSRSNSGQVVPENAHILVATSSPCEPYDIIDSINAVSSQKAGLGGVDLEGIFEHAKNKLRAKCIELGGDAVIDCHFSERSAHSGGIAPMQVIEVWSYGTVVKFRGKSNA